MSHRINEKPGTCEKCDGKGIYHWGAIVNGRPTKSGECFACKGKGKQTYSDIKRNEMAARYYCFR